MSRMVGKNKIWSDMYDTSEVQKEIADIKKRLRIKAFWMLILTPLIGTIYGFIMQMAEVDEMKWWGGLLLSMPLEIIFIFYIIRKAFTVNKKPFEGTVSKKKKYVKDKRSFFTTFFFGARSGGEDMYDTGNHYDVYEIQVKRTTGGKSKIKYRDDETFYNYVKEGDLVRYYPLFDTLEKYDKTNAKKTYCIVCGEENPIANIRCPNCGHRLYSMVEKTGKNEIVKQEITEETWNGEKLTMARLMTSNFENNDEAGEAYYSNGWDKDDPSWQCDCGFWNEENYCGNCGKSK